MAGPLTNGRAEARPSGRNGGVGAHPGNDVPGEDGVDLLGYPVENFQDLGKLLRRGHELHDGRKNLFSQDLRMDRPLLPVHHEFGNRIVLLEFNLQAGKRFGYFFHIGKPGSHAGAAELEGHSIHSPFVAASDLIRLHLLCAPSGNAGFRMDFQGIAKIFSHDPRPFQGRLE